MPAPPVLLKEMLETARRGRYFVLRVAFALFLLALMRILWDAKSARLGGGLKSIAEFGNDVFFWVATIQSIALFVLVPIVVCPAIAAEREMGSLDLLFLSDLTNHEIVFGKLANRLAILILMVMSGFPILLLITLLGGVQFSNVLFAIGLSVVETIGLATISLAYSARQETQRRALIGTYSTSALFVAVSFILLLVIRDNAEMLLRHAFFIVDMTLLFSLILYVITVQALRLPIVRQGRNKKWENYVLYLRHLRREASGDDNERADDFWRGELDQEFDKRQARRKTPRPNSRINPAANIRDLESSSRWITALGVPAFVISIPLLFFVWVKVGQMGAAFYVCAMFVGFFAAVNRWLDPRRSFRISLLMTPLTSRELLTIALQRPLKDRMSKLIGYSFLASLCGLALPYHHFVGLLGCALSCLLVFLAAAAFLASGCHTHVSAICALSLTTAIWIAPTLFNFVLEGLPFFAIAAMSLAVLALGWKGTRLTTSPTWIAIFCFGMLWTFAVTFTLIGSLIIPKFPLIESWFAAVSPLHWTVAFQENRLAHGNHWPSSDVIGMQSLLYCLSLASTSAVLWLWLILNFDRLVGRPTHSAFKVSLSACRSLVPMRN